MDGKEWNLLDRKAIGAIRLIQLKLVAFNIKNKNTIASLMAALTNMYKQPSTTNKVHPIKQLFNLKMPKNENFR